MNGERAVRKRLAALERRVATMIMTGTAETSQGAKTKVRFDDDAQDGKPFSSPLLPHAEASGKAGGGVSRFRRIGDGEPVLVLSPGGELGEHSRVMPAGPVEQHPSPGTAEQDGEIIAIGNATLSIKDGAIALAVAGVKMVIAAGGITITGGTVRHDDLNIGASHVHGGVTPGGANTSIPQP
mgnify:CR=1 FL=1